MMRTYTGERYFMAFSEKTKLAVKRNAHFSCCVCHRTGQVEVHHIIPQEENGPDTEENAAPLCPSCHELYGANRLKRKAITEMRDFWYEHCRMQTPSTEKLEEIAARVRETATKEDLSNAIEQIAEFGRFKRSVLADEEEWHHEPRSEEEVLAAMEALFDKVWYNRHWNMLDAIERGKEKISPAVLKLALEAARRKEEQYGKDQLGPWDDFEWGMLNGKLSALRWVLGDEWDFLDT